MEYCKCGNEVYIKKVKLCKKCYGREYVRKNRKPKPFKPNMAVRKISVIDGEHLPKFGHEKLFFNILKLYNIRVRYEGVRFKLPAPMIKYTPDIYLLKYGLYIELSKTRQSFHQSKSRIDKTCQIYKVPLMVIRLYAKPKNRFWSTSLAELKLDNGVKKALRIAIDACSHT